MLIKLAWRNLWRNKLRTGVMLGAMMFGLMGAVMITGLMSGMFDNMVHNAIDWQISHLQIHHRQYVKNPEIQATIADAERLQLQLAHNPQVKAFSARFLIDGMISSARSSRGVRINGIDTEAEAKLTPLAGSMVAGNWLSAQGKKPVLVSAKIAKRLKLNVKSKVVLTLTNGSGEVTGAAFRVHGIFQTPSSPFDDNNIFVRRDDLQTIAGMAGVHEIAVLATDGRQVDDLQPLIQLRANIAAEMSAQNLVQDWTQVQPLLASMLATTRTSAAIILGIFVLAMGLGIVNVMLMSVFERTQEFGVLMAVGMEKRQLFGLIVLESGWLGICGALLGVAGSGVLITLLQHTGLPLGRVAEGLGAYGIDTVLYPYVSVTEYLVIFATVVLSALLAALYPARQILKQRPVEAMAEKH
ncbi:ABC transporter permease YtrF precursor [Vibrio aerogenes CECT 7868]|uniref:ABC transporter permease YtrF n=1 Tax=Vibrio aerogenes CECT 7868 TaxID=1216006 RepID=A0A1M5ZBB1_9VIBR|nr:FtsX-like permease family protein [Vibrio aerogenes]SHI21193.1 ABC transporter permease YtrF precursor [Vibrio aerogenes CECT 7868]